MTSTRKGSMHVYDLIGVLVNAEKKLLKYGALEEKLIEPEKLEKVLESLAAAGVSPPEDLKTLLMDAEEKLIKHIEALDEKLNEKLALVETLDEKLNVGYKKRLYLLNKIAKTQRKLTANEKELEAEERQN